MIHQCFRKSNPADRPFRRPDYTNYELITNELFLRFHTPTSIIKTLAEAKVIVDYEKDDSLLILKDIKETLTT